MFDLVIRNGMVVDGSGNPWFKADIGIEGELISEIGRLSHGKEEIDARGRIVSPGFIDVHTHSDLPLLVDPRAESKVRQGVTTEVVGNCGSSAAPLLLKTMDQMKHHFSLYDPSLEVDWTTMDEYLARLEKSGIGVNCLTLIGHGTIREGVMGVKNALPTDAEMSQMKRLIEESMAAGAIGISTGLIYPPSDYAMTEELVELAKTVSKLGGFYFTHMRGDGSEAVEEVIRIAREADISCQIAHLHGYHENALLIGRAREKGLDITFDQYPYIAGSSGLKAVIPSWAHEGGKDELLSRLKRDDMRRRIREEIKKEGIISRPGLSWSKVVVSAVTKEENRRYEGKPISDIARMQGKDEFDTLFDLLIEENAEASMITFGWSEEGVRKVMASSAGMVASDGSSLCTTGPLSKGKPHPRNYGNFVRVLGKYVREEKVLSLQEAIRQMTSAPANRLHLWNRGLIRPSMYADIVIFDEAEVRDAATFENPHQYAEGIDYVIVNGKMELSRGKRTDLLSGKVLRFGKDLY
ncbi:D-aminoacylase [subsurface metagenome]